MYYAFTVMSRCGFFLSPLFSSLVLHTTYPTSHVVLQLLQPTSRGLVQHQIHDGGSLRWNEASYRSLTEPASSLAFLISLNVKFHVHHHPQQLSAASVSFHEHYSTLEPDLNFSPIRPMASTLLPALCFWSKEMLLLFICFVFFFFPLLLLLFWV